MKKTLYFLMLLCFGQLAMAQNTNEKEFKITIGDTIVWKPFDNCDNIGYNISNRKSVSFSPIKYGEKVQVIGLQSGESRISATCNDSTVVAVFIVQKPFVAPAIVEKPQKPETQAFSSNYRFVPPTNHFFITFTDPINNCRETFVKVGDDEAYNNGMGVDRFWNIKTGKNWFYRPEAQGWSPEVDWEFEPFGDSFFPLNAFAREVVTDDLSQYYIGMEKVLDVNCWMFFVDREDGDVIRYWVDPTNGCTLRRQVNNDEPREVAVYDLKYTKLYFGPKFKKSLHDTTR